ncbi:MAG TPA: GNAT family protein [Solirubrobacterales bacterium]|nr:GNAT family protein [Solirubrobacterales bacterium]
MPRFELSDGVQLRSLTEADVKELYGLIEANRSYLAPWMPWAAGQTVDGTAEFVRKSIKQEADDDGFQVAVIVDGAIAGVLGHELDRENRTTTIGYWLAEDQQGRGLMTAAVKRLLEHAFDELRLNRVGIEVAPNNPRSRALAERLGFREEGVLREAERFADDDYRDLLLYSMLASEWSRGASRG